MLELHVLIYSIYVPRAPDRRRRPQRQNKRPASASPSALRLTIRGTYHLELLRREDVPFHEAALKLLHMILLGVRIFPCIAQAPQGAHPRTGRGRRPHHLLVFVGRRRWTRRSRSMPVCASAGPPRTWALGWTAIGRRAKWGGATRRQRVRHLVTQPRDARVSTCDVGARCKNLDLYSGGLGQAKTCLLYTSPSPRDRQKSRMPSSA